jgi:hypothetical protein
MRFNSVDGWLKINSSAAWSDKTAEAGARYKEVRLFVDTEMKKTLAKRQRVVAWFELVRWIQGELPITLHESKSSKLISRAGESERDFRMRIADREREARDAEAEKLRKKYEPRFTTLRERVRRAEQAVEKEQGQSQQAMLGAAVAVGGSLLGALLGGRKGRGAGTAMRGAGRAARSRQDIAHAQESVTAARAQLDELEGAFAEELRRVKDGAGSEEVLSPVVIRPALKAISLRLVCLAWLPEGSAEGVRYETAQVTR